MKDIRWIDAVLFISLFALTGYMPAALQQDFGASENTDGSREIELMEETSSSRFRLVTEINLTSE